MASFTPFLAERIYTNLNEGESVHLSEWPNENEKRKTKNEKLIEEMEVIRAVAEKAHALRKEAEIPLRQPLAALEVLSPKIKPGPEVLNVLAAEVNVKKVDWSKSNSETVKLDKKITPELEEEAKVRDMIRSIQEERKGLGLNLGQKVDASVPKLPKDEKLVNWMIRKAQIRKLAEGKFKVSKVRI